MANDAGNVVVGANGSVWVAALDADAPTDVATAMDDTQWTDLGFVTEDGVTPNFGKDVTEIGAWQAFYAIRRVVAGRTAQITFALREWKRANVELALEGTVEANAGEYILRPNPPETLDERQLVCEWADGTKDYRLWFPNGMVSDAVEFNLTRTDSSSLPVVFGVNDPGSDEFGDPLDAWLLFTNDPAFAAVSS